MKKTICFSVSLVLMLTMVSCFGRSSSNTAASVPGTQASGFTQAAAETSSTQTLVTSQAPSESDGNNTASSGNSGYKAEELVQSANADLDADSKEEVIQIYRAVTPKSGNNGANEIEGILKIKSATVSKEIVFNKKDEGQTDVMSSFEIRDMDNDGAKDIFIVIPDAGAAFDINYFYMYSFKLDKSYSFYTDSSLSDFAGGFTFTYNGKGILTMANAACNFKAKLDITSKNKGITADDENNNVYENSWVEPVPVVINVSSKLAIEKSSDGKTLIKVPLPVFGQATADMIGEVDIFYAVDKNFVPYMYKFDVIDFSDTGSVKAGSAKIQ